MPCRKPLDLFDWMGAKLGVSGKTYEKAKCGHSNLQLSKAGLFLLQKP
jgi:hypothetical protein